MKNGMHAGAYRAMQEIKWHAKQLRPRTCFVGGVA